MKPLTLEGIDVTLTKGDEIGHLVIQSLGNHSWAPVGFFYTTLMCRRHEQEIRY